MRLQHHTAAAARHLEKAAAHWTAMDLRHRVCTLPIHG
jgi:hypothetical protein